MFCTMSYSSSHVSRFFFLNIKMLVDHKMFETRVGYKVFPIKEYYALTDEVCRDFRQKTSTLDSLDLANFATSMLRVGHAAGEKELKVKERTEVGVTNIELHEQFGAPKTSAVLD